MDFEWDEAGRAGVNFRKHGVRSPKRFRFSMTHMPPRLGMTNPGEQRFVTIGVGAMGRLLVAVYSWRAGTIRIIIRAFRRSP